MKGLQSMRLDKYLAESYVGSRKAVRLLIKEAKIKVNNEVILDPVTEVSENDSIVYQEQRVIHPGKHYIMFHKPMGCVTSKKDDSHKTVMEYFPEESRTGLFPVGRLDRDTEGLLLFTNDGEFDYQLMNPKHHVEKRYFFWVLGTLSRESIKQLETGIDIGEFDTITKPAKVEVECSGTYNEFENKIPCIDDFNMKHNRYIQEVTAGYITITEGRKHQVKRMLKAVGCYVVYLKRVQIGTLVLDENLQPGEYRELTKEEVDSLINSDHS